ncbi:helix-turn-helix domain-containing protein [Clostridium sp. 19966]|uniref:Helix-turn-helix domain-containing protein n=1 Tax=Clostridium butyricum TaxID=1492 RepID=A0A6N2ZRR7_CLOBU|nr:helix-turn-helix domain-containing protein [Clostridium sp. 19966]MDT8717055.1 helix-turn-helix domain-containing protein [Clostridium sp. 19966]
MNDELVKYKLAGTLKTTIAGKLIYGLLCEIADSDGKVQVPIKKISYTLSIGENTVRRNLHRLEEKGYIDIRKIYHDDGGRAANIYIIK